MYYRDYGGGGVAGSNVDELDFRQPSVVKTTGFLQQLTHRVLTDSLCRRPWRRKAKKKDSFFLCESKNNKMHHGCVTCCACRWSAFLALYLNIGCF